MKCDLCGKNCATVKPVFKEEDEETTFTCLKCQDKERRLE